MENDKRERLQDEGRTNARRGEQRGNTSWQSLTSSLEAERERSTGFRREKLMIERERERDRR